MAVFKLLKRASCCAAGSHVFVRPKQETGHNQPVIMRFIRSLSLERDPME
jgi:hypothetical protein